jgi:D-alanyl-D-alanine carboxypeptidase
MLRSIVIVLSILCAIACESKQKELVPSNVSKSDISQNSIQVQEQDSISIDFLTGRFDPSRQSGFVKILPQHTDKNGIYLQKEVYEQFKKMREAAAKDGLTLIILSATRNFDAQKRIWERKWNNLIAQGRKDESAMALEILKFSSMPGTSRHHWGTEIDLNSLENVWYDSPEGQKLYNWLTTNASKFGFCQPYSTKNSDRPTGYEEEKWHWSYMPLSQKYTRAASEKLEDEMITGFKGSETAKSIGVVEKYVLGIAKTCR